MGQHRQNILVKSRKKIIDQFVGAALITIFVDSEPFIQAARSTKPVSESVESNPQ